MNEKDEGCYCGQLGLQSSEELWAMVEGTPPWLSHPRDEGVEILMQRSCLSWLSVALEKGDVGVLPPWRF